MKPTRTGRVSDLAFGDGLDESRVVPHPVQVKAITYSAARENLATTMQAVCDDREPVIITRKRDQAVVMISLDDFEAMQETAYLQRSPENASRLLSAIEQLESRRGKARDLADLG